MNASKTDKMILCFEGPSAIGKSSLAARMSDQFQVVPEVNILFASEERAGELWYYRKQVERYQLCRPPAAILDGDVFQPLWYNWIYGYPAAFPKAEESHRFYLQMIEEGQLRFPDQYVVFHCSEEILWQRKRSDTSRQRRNFEKHLQLIEPQKRYFEFLEKHTEIDVSFIPYESQGQALAQVQNLIEKKQKRDINDTRNFLQILEWLQAHTK